MKRQDTYWEKTFTIHISDKGLSYILQINKKDPKPNLKVGKRLEQALHKRRYLTGKHEKGFKFSQ